MIILSAAQAVTKTRLEGLKLKPQHKAIRQFFTASHGHIVDCCDTRLKAFLPFHPGIDLHSNMAQKADRKKFEDFYPTLIKDLTEHVQGYNIPSNALEWFQKVCYA